MAENPAEAGRKFGIPLSSRLKSRLFLPGQVPKVHGREAIMATHVIPVFLPQTDRNEKGVFDRNPFGHSPSHPYSVLLTRKSQGDHGYEIRRKRRGRAEARDGGPSRQGDRRFPERPGRSDLYRGRRPGKASGRPSRTKGSLRRAGWEFDRRRYCPKLPEQGATCL